MPRKLRASPGRAAARSRLWDIEIVCTLVCLCLAASVRGQGTFGGPTDSVVVWYRLDEATTSKRVRVSCPRFVLHGLGVLDYETETDCYTSHSIMCNICSCVIVTGYTRHDRMATLSRLACP